MPTFQQKPLYEGKNSLIYLQKKSAWNTPVIVKMLRNEYPSLQQISQFSNEFEFTHNLDIAGVRKAYKAEKHQNKHCLILEHIEGVTLKKFVQNNGVPDLGLFLKIAIQLAQTLGEIHQQNIIHKDINPGNILINPETLHTTIIDFGISSKISIKTSHSDNPDNLEGTLAYISPEQTGRMNRTVDHRTDLYSLGITFYELLAGKLPFRSSKAMVLVHAHIAQKPIRPAKVPSVLTDIVMRLTEKNAEDRYQSAFGLKRDLEQCLRNMEDSGNISDFKIGQKDFSGKFQIPEKLYGREKEVNVLLNAFDRVCEGGKELVLVSGYSGVGKSALVNQIHTPVIKQKGYFISGKFDQFQCATPYSAISQALNQFCEYILSENEETLAAWKKTILQAAGNNGQILVELIPDLEKVTGVQSEAAEVDVQQAQNRFEFVFQRFIEAISQKEHPLVLFIDDLQWADLASLNLLKTLLSDQNNQYFLVIGAYRNNEVSAIHPLMLSLEEIRKMQVNTETIELSPLSQSNLQALLSDALHATPPAVKSLAQLVYTKTEGNAFFSIELLKSLYRQALLIFDHQQVRWMWDIERIASKELTDHVIDLMTSKIHQLPPATQEVFALASCIGNQFDLHTLSVIYKHNQADTLKHLWGAIDEELLEPLDDNYKLIETSEEGQQKERITKVFRFAHDKIQQAAYLLIKEEKKKGVHLEIGRLLQQNTKGEEFSFGVVNHLNMGLKLITDKEEKLQLTRFNLQAGKKANSSGAYQSAYDYLNLAMNLLETDSWQTEYALTLGIYNNIVEVTYLMKDYEQMEALAEVVFQKAVNLLDKIPVYETRIVTYTAQAKYSDAVKTSLQLLKLLGIKFSGKPGKLQVNISLLKTKTALRDKSFDDLARLPVMTDSTALATIRILNMSLTSSYFTNANLATLMILKMVRLSIRHGNAPDSTVAYVIYGFLLCNSLDATEQGYQFGEFALRLLSSVKAKKFEAKVTYNAYAFIIYYKNPLKSTIPHLLKAHRLGLENGDLEYANSSLAIYAIYLFCSGEKLENILPQTIKSKASAKQFGQEDTAKHLEILHQTILCFQGKTEVPYYLTTEKRGEEAEVNSYIEAESKHILSVYCFYKLILCYLFEKYAKAHQTFQLVKKHVDFDLAYFTKNLFCFYDSLTQMAIFPQSPKKQQRKILKQVKANQKKMHKWAHHCPENFLHKYHLVEAEKHRVLAKTEKAIEHYDQAIRLAQKHEFLQEEALANELFAKFWWTKDKEDLAGMYMQKAHYLYGLWGAKAKTNQLEEKYPRLLHKKSYSSSSMVIGSSDTGNASNESLDLSSVLQAFQTLSQEVKLTHLIEKMLQVVLENSGAQRGILIDNDQNNLLVKARGNAQGGIRVLEGKPLKDSPNLSQTIVRYVARTKETLLLNDAIKEKRYANDAYIQKKKPRSILCFPVLRQGELSVIFYLENRLAANTFTSERLETLKTLSAQMAISIENALLYENLEDKVKERTQELSNKNEELSAAGEVLTGVNAELQKRNKHIMASINYARRIQKAVLPVEDRMLDSLPEHFVFFRPRDIVSGDFYWFEAMDDKIFMVAADCTGHGVPGAFMTMLGAQALTNIVGQKKIHSPEQILKALDSALGEMLQKSKETSVRDGMDIVITVIDAQKQELHYAGAKNPLVIIRNEELQMIKGDMYSINGYRKKDETAEYALHTIDLSEPLSFYMYSDGLQDQFAGVKDENNGERYEKFSRKRLLNLLFDIHQKPMPEQHQAIARAMDDWQNDHEQIDDMLLVGVRCVPGMF